MYIAMSMSMTYIQLIQQCALAIWGGGVTLNFYRPLFYRKLCILKWYMHLAHFGNGHFQYVITLVGIVGIC